MISTKADITFFYSVIVKVGDIVKNKLKLLLLLLLLLLSLVSFIQVSYSKKTIDSKKNHVETIPYDTTPSFLTNQTQELSQLKAVVSISGTDLLENVVQADDNQFYLDHDIYGNESEIGSNFLDYRLRLEENPKKILIYGHNSKTLTLPFQILENYQDFSYYQEHPTIVLETATGKSTYQIFSAFIETENWDYMNLKFADSKEWLQHLESLKERSFYDTGIDVTEQDSILILQTCSENPDYDSYPKKYFLLIGRRI